MFSHEVKHRKIPLMRGFDDIFYLPHSRHTSISREDVENEPKLKIIASSPVAGVPYREGIFSVWNDPAKFGLFYHSALILRRGDVIRAGTSSFLLL